MRKWKTNSDVYRKKTASADSTKTCKVWKVIPLPTTCESLKKVPVGCWSSLEKTGGETIPRLEHLSEMLARLISHERIKTKVQG